MVFLNQPEWQGVGYPLWDIPGRIWVSREVNNLVGVSYSYISVDSYIFSIKVISDVWQIFSIGESIVCWLIVDKAPIFINAGLCCSSQDGVSHMQYVGIMIVAQEHFLDFISGGLHLKDFFWLGMTNHMYKIWEVIPLLGGDAHQEIAWFILNISQCFMFSSSTMGLVTIFSFSHSSECFCILFDTCLCRAFTVTCIVTSSYTIIAGDVIKVSSGFFYIVFCFILIIPSFTTMWKYKLVSHTLRLGLPIKVIIRLEI